MHFILSLYSQLMGQNKGTFYGTSCYFGSESQCIGELILSLMLHNHAVQTL